MCFGEFWAVFFVRALASHCNANDLVLETLKHDKVWVGQLALVVVVVVEFIQLCGRKTK